MFPGRWDTQAASRAQRLARAASRLGSRLVGKIVAAADIVPLLETVIEPGDRVCLEGNNQKQADFLAKALARRFRDHPRPAHGAPVLALPEHLDIFENGIASRLDFSFSGPQAVRLAQLVRAMDGSPSAQSTPTSNCSADTSSISRRA